MLARNAIYSATHLMRDPGEPNGSSRCRWCLPYTGRGTITANRSRLAAFDRRDSQAAAGDLQDPDSVLPGVALANIHTTIPEH